MRLEVTYRSRPKVGEQANGDAAVVRAGPTHTMFAVIDALGHGPVANAVALRAVSALESASLVHGLQQPFEALHEALKGTRGAAVTIGLYTHDSATIELCGVGNVQVRGVAHSVPFVPTPGIVGGRASKPRFARVALRRGEGMLLLSDGIPRRATIGALASQSPQALCEQLLTQAHAHDDATVMLVTMAS